MAPVRLQRYAEAVLRRLYRRHNLEGVMPVIRLMDHRCGRWNTKHNRITLPLWLANRRIDYIRYYVAHELSHKYAGNNHGMGFQLLLAKLAGRDYHHEASYKPGAYAKAMKVIYANRAMRVS